MKKFLKSFITLSLLGSVITTNLSVFAEEAVEETETGVEVEEGAEGEEIDATVIEEPPSTTPVEDPSAAFELIEKASSEAISQKMEGVLSIGFSDAQASASIFELDYIISYNVEPRLSAELDIAYRMLQQEEPSNLFAYLHNGKLLEYRDETWYAEDLGEMETSFTNLIANKEGSTNIEFLEKYMDITEDDGHYYLGLKNEINIEEFWNDVNETFDVEKIKNNLRGIVEAQANVQGTEVDQSQLDVIDTFFSYETFEATMNNEIKLLQVYSKETGYLVNNLISAKVPVTKIYEIMGIDPATAPETLDVYFDSFNSEQGSEFDFSFLDEVAPPQE